MMSESKGLMLSDPPPIIGTVRYEHNAWVVERLRHEGCDNENFLASIMAATPVLPASPAAPSNSKRNTAPSDAQLAKARAMVAKCKAYGGDVHAAKTRQVLRLCG